MNPLRQRITKPKSLRQVLPEPLNDRDFKTETPVRNSRSKNPRLIEQLTYANQQIIKYATQCRRRSFFRQDGRLEVILLQYIERDVDTIE